MDNSTTTLQQIRPQLPVRLFNGFGALLEKIEGDLRRHGARIFAGDIAAQPYRKGNDRACDWCQFQPVCRFDSWIHPFNVLRKPPEEKAAKEDGE